jgi:uncharacterized protein with GYD domain
MPVYLIQVAYTPESVAALVKNPRNRAEELRPEIEKLGGKMHGFWFCFGDYDVTLLVEMPSNSNAAAIVMSAFAGGGLKSIKTTPLLTIEESIDALRKASQTKYEPPARTATKITA